MLTLVTSGSRRLPGNSLPAWRIATLEMMAGPLPWIAAWKAPGAREVQPRAHSR